MESFFASPVYYPLPSQTLGAINEAASNQTERDPLLMASAPAFLYTDAEFASVACLTDIDSLSTVSPPPRHSSSSSSPSCNDIDVEKSTLPRPRSRSRYQTTLGRLSNRPLESWMAFAAVTMSFVAMALLVFLMFVLAMQSMGKMGGVYNTVDHSLASLHDSINGVMCVLAGPDCPTEM